MFVTAWCTFLAALALFHYLFSSDLEKAMTNVTPSEISSEDGQQSSKNVEKCSSAFVDQASTSSSADQKTPSPSGNQTSSSSEDETSSSPTADQRSLSLSVSGDERTPWQYDQTFTSSFAGQKPPCPCVDQTSSFPSDDQTSASSSEDETSSSRSADQRILSPSGDERTPWQYDHTFTSSFAGQKPPSPSVEQTLPSPSADQESRSPSADQRSPSLCLDQTSALSTEDETPSLPSADQRSLSPSGDERTPWQYDQTFTSSFAGQKPPSPSVEQTRPSPSADRESCSPSADQRSLSLCLDQTSALSTEDETSSLPSADQRSLSPSGDEITPWQYDQTLTSSFAGQKPPSPSVEQTPPSSSADQISRSTAADQRSPSLRFDQTSACLSSEDETSLSSADQRSLSLSGDEKTPSSSADQTSPSSSGDQTSLSPSGDWTSRSSTTNQTSHWPPALQRFPCSCADQTAEQKDSLSPFIDQTNILSLFPDQECSLWAFHDHESSSFADQVGSTSGQSNSFSAVYCQTRQAGSIFDHDSWPNVETSCVARPTMETMEEALRPHVSNPPCTMPSGTSECHTRPIVPTIAYTTFPILNGRSIHSTIRQSTTSLYAPVSAAVRPLMSCEIRSPALPSLMSIQTTHPVPSSNVDTIDNRFHRPAGYFMPSNNASRTSRTYGNTAYVPGSDSRFPTTTGRHIPASNLTAPKPYGNTSGIPGSVPITPLMSCDVRPPVIPSFTSIQTTKPVSSSNVNFDTRFPTPTGYSTPSNMSSPRRYGNTFCVPQSVPITPITSCDIKPPVIPSLMSIMTTPPLSSSNVTFANRVPTQTGCYTPRSASRTYGNTFCAPGSVPTRPLKSRDVRPPVIPSLMSIQTTPPVPNPNVIFASRFPTQTGCSTPSSASRTYGNTFCAPGSVPTRPLMSCDVRPPVIPSLMSIQTTPPVFRSNVNFDTRFPTPSGRHTPASNINVSGPYRRTSCIPGSVPIRPLKSGDVRPPVIPSLMSIQTTPPVPCNDIRYLRNHGNRGVPDPVATTIPSLMSIQTRPPWEPRLPQPPGLGNPYW